MYASVEIFGGVYMRPFGAGLLIHMDLIVAQPGAGGLTTNVRFRESRHIFRADHRNSHAAVKGLIDRIPQEQSRGAEYAPIALISAMNHVRKLADQLGNIKNGAQVRDKHAAGKSNCLGFSGLSLHFEMGWGLVQAI